MSRQDISFRFHRDGRVTVTKDTGTRTFWGITLEPDEWVVLGEACRRTEEARQISTIGLTTLREEKP